MDAKNEKRIKKKLKKFFKFESFKSKEQYEATLAVWTENRDILINLPPAAGKSICFQLPTILFREKITVVIVPNNNAVEDQISFLTMHGIKACYFHSKYSLINIQKIVEKIITRALVIQFIYVTITMIIQDWFKNLIEVLNSDDLISMFVVDEAHCVSKQSIDFIKLYTEINKMRNLCPETKLVALTSIGSDNIMTDIKNCLQLQNPCEITHLEWRRPNIYIQVKFKDIIENPFEDMKELITNFMNFMDDFSGIIFCRKVEDTTLIAHKLTQLDIPTVAYHSKMKKKCRNQSKENWMTGKVKMIATTHDFGMRLDKPLVACIIHWSFPFTMEQYYRNIGKAGRNGEKSLCRIYFGVEDWMNAQVTAMGMSNQLFKDFENVIQYCISDECRHLTYSRYFGINIDPCHDACDSCERNIHFEKALDKFRIFHNQRKLLLKIKYLPITEIYSDQQTEKFIKNLKTEMRMEYYRKLSNAFVENYENSNCINKQYIEVKYLCRLARNLEYLQFSTSYEKDYYGYKMLHLIEEIEKTTRLKKLSNYILNYKFRAL